MSEPRLAMQPASPQGREPLAPAPHLAWEMIALAGFVFLSTGLFDLALVWIPWQGGSPEWEFGTVSTMLDRIPLAALGLVLVLAAGRALGRRWMARTAAAILLALGLFIVPCAVIYWTVVPMALDAAPGPVVVLGLKKAIAKTTAQAAVYPLAFVWLAIRGWRGSGARVRR